MPRLPLPSAGVAAVCAVPAARARCSGRGEAGHAVAPGVRLGSSLGRRCEVWACSHPTGMVTVTFAIETGSSVGAGARRAAALKAGRSTAQAIANGAHEPVSGPPGVGWVMRAIAQINPTISRAIAVVTTTVGLPDAASRQ